MLNKIFSSRGRLVADPELRHTQNGVAVAFLPPGGGPGTRTGKPGSGRPISSMSWPGVRRESSSPASSPRGRLAVVEGGSSPRLHRPGRQPPVRATEVVADNVYFGDSRRDGEGGGYTRPPGWPEQRLRRCPAGNNSPSGGGFTSSAPAVNQFADLTDDDGELPF